MNKQKAKLQEKNYRINEQKLSKKGFLFIILEMMITIFSICGLFYILLYHV